MLHGADEHVKKQLLSDMTMKTEVEEAAQSSAHVDIEIHENHMKEEPGLLQFVKSEPALLVKEEILEDSRRGGLLPLSLHDGNEQQCVQGTPIPAGTRSVKEACSTRLGDLINIKHEQSDIVIGPTVLQHMDIHYTINKETLRSHTSTTSTRAIVGSTSVAADNINWGQLLDIKEEYTDMDIGPTVLQHMDSHYTSNQIELNAIRQDNTIISLDAEEVLYRIRDGQVRNETTEDIQKDNNMLSYKYCGQTMREEDYTKGHLKLHQQKNSKTSVTTSSAVAGPSNQSQDEIVKTKQKPFRVYTGVPYQCGTCNASCADKNALTNHMRVHTGEKPFICSECGAKFAVNGALTRHMKVHTGEKPFMCSECRARFAESSALTIHVRVHTGEKPYVCSECGAKFSRHSALTVHMRLHMAVKPFVCSECGAKFSRRSALTKHMRVHMGETPFVCSECGAKFKQKSTYTVHVRDHTGEKPFVCNECGAKFTQSSSLTIHMRVHMGKQPHG